MPPLRGEITPLRGLTPPGGGDCRPPILRFSAFGLRCSPPRPPGGLAAPRLRRLPPQPTPAWQGEGVRGLGSVSPPGGGLGKRSAQSSHATAGADAAGGQSVGRLVGRAWAGRGRLSAVHPLSTPVQGPPGPSACPHGARQRTVHGQGAAGMGRACFGFVGFPPSAAQRFSHRAGVHPPLGFS